MKTNESISNLYKKVMHTIEKYNRIIIMPHVRPDGDAYGAAFGLKEVLRKAYPSKQVDIHGSHLSYTTWMGDMKLLEKEDFKDSLLITIDTSERTLWFDEIIDTCALVIRLDHYPYVSTFADIELIDDSRPSTANIIVECLEYLNIPIPTAAAEYFYFGVLMDTQRFRIKQVDAKTHRLIAHLLDQDIDKSKVHEHVYLRPLKELAFEQYVLGQIQTTPNGMIYITLTNELLQKYSILEDVASRMLRKIEGVSGYPIWGIFYETSDGLIKSRIRSRGPEIGEFSKQFSGGSYKHTAGIILKSWKDFPEVIEAFDTYLKENKD